MVTFAESKLDDNLGNYEPIADTPYVQFTSEKVQPTCVIIQRDDSYVESDTDPLSPATEKRTLRYAIFTMLPVFMGYASLVTLQAEVKGRLGIGDDSSAASYEFSFAASLLYLGNLIFRLMHNIFFCMFRPRYRVVISYVSMTAATGLLGLMYFFLNSHSLLWAYIAFCLGGVSIGTFESNLISVLTPLGHGTKVWAQYGISVGFNGISIGAFILFACFPNQPILQGAVYIGIAVANFLGLLFFIFCIPDVTFESSHKTIKGFFSDIKHFREWAPQVLVYAITLALDMFTLSLASAIQLYIYDVNAIPLFVGSAMTIPKNVFRAVFNSCSLIGDATGRHLAYKTPKHIHPTWFLMASGVGLAMVLSKQGLLAPFGMLIVMFANGSIYAHTTKYVDDVVNHRFNLISLSFWLFIGDIGSFSGANVVNPLRVLLGSA